MDFRRGVITPASTWRALILYGANAATYKFAFGRALLGLAAEGRETVGLEDVAPRYAALLGEALEREPRQGTAPSSKFLDALRAHTEGRLSLDDMHAATVRSGFTNVVDAFPMLGGDLAPVKFYEDRRKDSAVRGLVLTPALLELAQREEREWLDGETDARWRLVETAWATGLNPGLVAPIEYDEDTQALFTVRTLRRRNVSGVVQSLSGYQDGRCAYCQQDMSQLGIGKPIVEHVLPLVLRRERWEGPPLEAVWNLVLSCQPCNSAKWGRAPHESWMPWLLQRNDDLIASHHPLRQTLMAQTGDTVALRATTLRAAYRLATERLPATWTPPRAS